MEEESAATMRANIKLPHGGFSESGYLRTGDYGFIYDRNLFISGRLKDLIIIHGRSIIFFRLYLLGFEQPIDIFPQDVELLAEESNKMIKPGWIAAFPVEFGNGMSGFKDNWAVVNIIIYRGACGYCGRAPR